MPYCYQLIGPPCVGKTTYVEQNDAWVDGKVYVSTDRLIHAYAKEQGKTYVEVFEEYMPQAIERMNQQVQDARKAGLDIIWDQTNTTVKSRARKFNMLPDYRHIAIVFPIPEISVLKERLASRVDQPIPWEVVQGMMDQFEYPTSIEGFETIQSV